MSNFDAFGAEAVAPEPQDNTWFGEFVILRGFQGIARKGIGIEEYDATNPEHQAEIAGGKKVNVCYEYQFFPMNSQFESFPRTVFKWSKEWGILAGSLAEVWELDMAKQAAEFGNKLRQLTNGGQYARWENVPTSTYKNAAGEEKQKYAQKVLALYASAEECQAAYDKTKGIDGAPDRIPGFDGTNGPKVDALPLAQALGFVEALARQCIGTNGVVDLVALQEKIDAMPMLANLIAESREVTDRIKAAGMELLPF